MPDAAGSSAPIYTAERIAAVLARRTFDGALCVVDRCTRLGAECDLLVVTRNLRAIDVEIKLSRADLKADRVKDKWYDYGERDRLTGSYRKTTREWPRSVFKHYYVLPAPIWRVELLQHCMPKSGVIVVDFEHVNARRFSARRSGALIVKRRATPNRNCQPLKHETVVDIARLASLRMWDAYRDLEVARADNEHERRGAA